MMKNSKLVLLLAGFIIFVALLYFIGIEGIFYRISKLNVFYYTLSIVCFFASIFLWTLRWKSFFRFDDLKISTSELFKNLVIGLAINNLTPVAKLGGEPVRIYILKKKNGIPVEKGTATVLADLTLELVTSSVLVLVSIVFIMIFINPPVWLSMILFVFSLMTLMALFWVFDIYSGLGIINKIILWVTEKIKRITPLRGRIIKGYKKFQKCFREIMKNRNLLIKTTLYGFTMKFFDILKFFLIFYALGFEINLVQIVIALGMGIVLMSIPATPGNLGIFEGGMIAAFVLIGIPIDISAAAIFLERIVSFWLITITGVSLGTLYGISNLGKGLRNIKTHNQIYVVLKCMS